MSSSSTSSTTANGTTSTSSTTGGFVSIPRRPETKASREALQQTLTNLTQVEAALQSVLQSHQQGQYGYITRKWGFSTPGGLGGKLGGKFRPWERILEQVPSYFWPIDCYRGMDELPDLGRPDPESVRNLPPEGEQLPGNTPLHVFLQQATPNPPVILEPSDYADYRTAARIFLLLGTLSHLYGNSAKDRTQAPLPTWIEDPLRLVAERLQVEPTLSGHFLVQENWIWKSSVSQTPEMAGKTSQNQLLLTTLLQSCVCQDRRFRLKLYPNCFVGSQCVDVVMEHDFASSRQQAVHLLRALNEQYDLFHHVTNDHSIMDKYLFYRFKRRWQAVRDHPDPFRSLELSSGEINTDDIDEGKNQLALNRLLRPGDLLRLRSDGSRISQSSTGNSVSSSLHELSSEETMAAIAAMGMVPIKDRRYGLRTYRHCFVGSQLVDVLLKHDCAMTRKDAVLLGRQLNDRFQLFQHVVENHKLKDAHLFYKFTDQWKALNQRNGMDSMSNLASPTTESSSVNGNARGSIWDENATTGDETSVVQDLSDTIEFRIDNIDMLYPAFANNHERINQLIPACMGHALAELPFHVLDTISCMRNILDMELNPQTDESVPLEGKCDEMRHLYDLLFNVAVCISRCKEEFQQMSTDPTKRTFNSKYVSIKQTQPLSNGVLVRRTKGGKPEMAKGTTGTQFPYFHVLDWFLGRFQFASSDGLVAKIAQVDDTFPKPQREFIGCLTRLEKDSTLCGFIEALGAPHHLLTAYNHLIECYAGEGGLLQAHCRKLYSYMHNNVQSSTSGTNHLKSQESATGCPMAGARDNHEFAIMMFRHMRKAAADRWKLRLPPLMEEVGKVVYSTSESGGFTTVALDLGDSGLQYEYGDVVKVLLPNNDKTTVAWVRSLEGNGKEFFKLDDVCKLHKLCIHKWNWHKLWQALGWCRYERDGGKGVPLREFARYIEHCQTINDEEKLRWIKCPMDLRGRGEARYFASPPPIPFDMISSLEPVSPRIYSVSGVEPGRVFLLVSKPCDGARHHGYERMSDELVQRVHCSFSPATFFLVPPKYTNLVCVASGTGISPFVGLADAIGSREGSYTIVHQCKSSDLFLANAQNWLDFTAVNPGGMVMGYISGDMSRRNCPMRYIIRNGAFEETTVLLRQNASAYYFECSRFQTAVQESYKPDGLNLAYCCGGLRSAVKPLKDFAARKGMTFEFTCESYGLPPDLTAESRASAIGGSIVNLDHVAPIHPGGDQILHQLVDLESPTSDNTTTMGRSAPDHTAEFYELHPHAYNLHRCLQTPLDAESEAFEEFLSRQAISKHVMASMAQKYAQVALDSPKDSRIVRIATELQTTALREQMKSGDLEGAKASACFLEQLLALLPQDPDTQRWMESLEAFRQNRKP